MDELILLTEDEIAPIKLLAISQNIDKGNINITLGILNCADRTFVERTIARTEISSKKLEVLIERTGGLCPEPKLLCEKLKIAINNILVKNVLNDDSCIGLEHERLGWSVYQGEYVFFCDSIVSQSQTVYSTYVGDYDIRPHGSFEAVKRLLTVTLNGNIAMLAVASMAAAAPVLPFANKVWGMTIINPINHMAGNSSEGKSTAANLFCSFGGVPDGDGSYKLSFADTLNAILEKVKLNMGYPCAIDEVSTKDNGSDLTSFVYTLANHQSKDRCIAGGSEVSKHSEFMTVFLTNGENSIIRKCRGTDGIRARVLEFDVDSWTRNAEEADEINAVCLSNYGFLTPMIAQELLSDSEKWQCRFLGWIERIKARIDSEKLIINLGARLTSVVALYLVAAEILEVVLNHNIGISLLYDFFFNHILVKCASEENLCERAYNILKNYYDEHRSVYNPIMMDINCLTEDAFILPEDQEGFVDKAKRAHKVGGKVYPCFIAFKPDKLFEVLDSHHIPDPLVALREMRKEGLLRVKDKDRLKCFIKVNGQDLGFYCIWADIAYF